MELRRVVKARSVSVVGVFMVAVMSSASSA
jgi:hypothetical protein